MSAQPLACQLEAARHATRSTVEGRVANADLKLEAAVVRAIFAIRSGLLGDAETHLLEGGRSAERLLGRDSRRPESLVVTR